MKKNFTTAFLIAVFVFVMGCAESVSAQKINPPMVGGYKTMSVKDKQIIEATNFAVKAIAESEEMELSLDSIKSAQYQAGQFFNFKMLFKVFYQDGGETYDLCLTAHVSRSMKKEYKLISWTSLECPADPEEK